MKIGHKIRKIRDVKGYSQAYVAMKLGMSQTNYSKIEQGKSSPNLERLQKISEVLEIDPLKIIEFDEDVIFNNNNQKGGNAANFIHQEHSEKIEKLYQDQIVQLKAQIEYLHARIKFMEKNK